MTDPLADRVRAAVEFFEIPAMPAPAIAARIAAARVGANAAPRHRRPLIAVVGGTAVLAAALAVAVPSADTWLTPAYYSTLKRLTGRDFSHARAYDVPPTTVEQARRLTRFPILAPHGKRVLNVIVDPHDAGASLIVAVDVHAQARLDERWASGERSNLATQLAGVAIRRDGSIRRFGTRRWRIGRMELSMPIFTTEYRRYAEEVERATREAAATRTP